jgi:hypothetical protein
MADAAPENCTALQLVRDRMVNDSLIDSTLDFGSLFGDATYQSILQEAGYGKELEQLRQQQAAREADEQLTEQEPGARGQAAPFAGRTQWGHEVRVAE